MGYIIQRRDMKIVGENLFRITPIDGVPSPVIIIDDDTGAVFQAIIKRPHCIYYRLVKEGEEIGWDEDEALTHNM